MYLVEQKLRVVASYVAPVGSTTVFTPLTFVRPGFELEEYYIDFSKPHRDFYWLNGKSWTPERLEAYQAMGLTPALNYSSMTFKLKDAARLDDLRQLLADMEFTWVHSGERTKPYAMIEDEVFLNTTHSMERQM